MTITIKIGREKVDIKANAVDRIVNYFSPTRGEARLKSRIQMAVAGAYTGASRNRKAFRGWKVTDGDADADLLYDLPTLRVRSRDLTRNTPLAASAINTPVTHVIGSGLKYQANIDREFLGLSDDEADAWEATAERAFRCWAESVECDAARTLNFYEHQQLAFRAVLENGDIFYTLPHIRRAGSRYDLKLQAIEADRVSNENNVRDTTTLAGGIKTDANGAPDEYHIQATHPGGLMRSGRKWHKVRAFGPSSGRRNVLHLFEQRRPGQRRGIPYLAPVIESLKQLGRYTEAELMAAVVSGMFTVFIETEGGENTLGLPNDGTGKTSDSSAPDAKELGNGTIIGLAAGEKVTSANPGRPNAAFDPFIMAVVRQIGAALEIPFELLIKHFTASYSASRAAIEMAWKFFKMRRTFMEYKFCRPVLEAFMWDEVLSGRIVAPGFIEDPLIRKAWLGARWVGPGKGQIQELQEVKAARERVDGGFSTLAQETAEMNGGDWESNHRQQVKEKKARQRDGLGAQTAAPPAAAPDTSSDNPDDDGQDQTDEQEQQENAS